MHATLVSILTSNLPAILAPQAGEDYVTALCDAAASLDNDSIVINTMVIDSMADDRKLDILDDTLTNNGIDTDPMVALIFPHLDLITTSLRETIIEHIRQHTRPGNISLPDETNIIGIL